MLAIIKDLDARCYTEPPYQPERLVNVSPDDIRKRCQDKHDHDAKQLLHIWQDWLSESLKVRHQNQLNLRTLLRCYGITVEALELAKPDKKHVVQSTLDLLLAYLIEVWGLTDKEVYDAQNDVDHFAKQKVGIIASGYMNKEWCSSAYVVPE